MDTMGMVFGMSGLSFGMLGFAFAISALNKANLASQDLETLQRQLSDAGGLGLVESRDEKPAN